MKKWLSLLFSATLVFGIGTSAMAGKSTVKDIDKANAVAEKANAEILDIIEQGVVTAANLQEEYVANLAKLNASPQANDEIAQQVKVFLNEKYGAIIIDNEVNFEEQVDPGEASPTILLAVQQIEDSVVSEESSNQTFAKMASDVDTVKVEKVTEKHVKKLSERIAKVYEDTKKVSMKAIKDANKLGFEAKRYWVPVNFNGVTVQIDPIQIVGEL
ncbi:hypothetical protein [Pseudoneobacillus sp. C159]